MHLKQSPPETGHKGQVEVSHELHPLCRTPSLTLLPQSLVWLLNPNCSTGLNTTDEGQPLFTEAYLENIWLAD